MGVNAVQSQLTRSSPDCADNCSLSAGQYLMFTPVQKLSGLKYRLCWVEAAADQAPCNATSRKATC